MSKTAAKNSNTTAIKRGPLPQATRPKAQPLTLQARLDDLVDLVRRDNVNGVRTDRQIMADGRSIERKLAGLFRQKCGSADDVQAALIAAARMTDTIPADQQNDDDVTCDPPGKVAYWAAREARRLHDRGELRTAATASAAPEITPALAALCAIALKACEVLAPLDRDFSAKADEQREAAMNGWGNAMRAAGDHPSASRADVMAKLELSARCMGLLGYERGSRPSQDDWPYSCEMLEHAAMRDLQQLQGYAPGSPLHPKGDVDAFREGIKFAESAAATEWAARAASDAHIFALVDRHRRAYEACRIYNESVPGSVPPADMEKEDERNAELELAANLLAWSSPRTPEGFLQVVAALQMGVTARRRPDTSDVSVLFSWDIARMARDLTGVPS